MPDRNAVSDLLAADLVSSVSGLLFVANWVGAEGCLEVGSKPAFKKLQALYLGHPRGTLALLSNPDWLANGKKAWGNGLV